MCSSRELLGPLCWAFSWPGTTRVLRRHYADPARGHFRTGPRTDKKLKEDQRFPRRINTMNRSRCNSFTKWTRYAGTTQTLRGPNFRLNTTQPLRGRTTRRPARHYADPARIERVDFVTSSTTRRPARALRRPCAYRKG